MGRAELAELAALPGHLENKKRNLFEEVGAAGDRRRAPGRRIFPVLKILFVFRVFIPKIPFNFIGHGTQGRPFLYL